MMMKAHIWSLLLVSLALTGCATTAQRETQRSLDRIVIPVVAFRDANVHDVAEFLAGCAANQEPEPDLSVGLILQIPEEDRPTVTMTLKNVSLRAALDAVCRTGNLTYTVDRNGIIDIEEIPTKQSTRTKE